MTMRRAGYAPLESAGEYVCECLRDGDRVFPKWGNEVCERIVRCRDCRFAQELCDGMYDCNGPMVQTWDDYNDEPMDNPVPPSAYCAWGELRED